MRALEGHNLARSSFRMAGVILAGGNARRMGGIPKGMLRAGGSLSLIERLSVHMVRAGVEEIAISANDERPYARLGCTILADGRAGTGPLAGIEAALTHFADRYDAILCVPCDLPALSSREMSILRASLEASGGPVVFAETEGPMSHPLCAAVRTNARESISTALDEGAAGVAALWQRLGGSAVRFDDPYPFVNLNSPRDVDAWVGRRDRAVRLLDTADDR